MSVFRQPSLYGVLAAIALAFSCQLGPAQAQQQGRASVSATAGEPNAVFVNVPNEPCVFLYESLSDRITGLDLNFGPVKFDQRTYFLKYCREKRDELVARIKAPFEAAQARAEDAANKAASELTGGFWKFMSEQLYARLPAEERARYAPGTPEVEALAHRWLNEAPQEEFGTYVAAYLTAGGQESRLLDAWKVYVDLTNGESKTILEGAYKLLSDAKTRLAQILLAKQRIAEEPDTPISDIIRDVGLSGEWFEYFKSREAQIRGLNSKFRLAEVMEIVSDAMGSEDQSDKVRAFFQLMGLSGDVLAESNQPLFVFVGQIIRDYADVANQALDNALSLDGVIQRRNGYCLGEGVPSRDIRKFYFIEQKVMACPLSYGTWPLKHVYQSQGGEPTRLFFYDGSSFIEAENPSGPDGVIAAAKLITDAIALGYPIVSDPDAHIARIAAVYNTVNPGGVPGLMRNAREIVATIEAAVTAVKDLHRPGDTCSADQVLSAVARRAGFSTDSFLRDLANGGADRLASAIAASFIAFEGRFGRGVTRGDGANAYETYSDLADALSRASVLILEGRVLNSDRSAIPGASLDIAIGGGQQVEGCEVSQADAAGRFSVFALGDGRSMSITGQASTPDTRGVRETFDVAYFRRNGFTFAERDGGLTTRADGELIVPERDAPPGEEADDEEGVVVPPPVVTPEQSAACRAVDLAVAAARSELAVGLFDRLPEVLSKIDEAVAAQESLENCGPETASGVAKARELLTIAQRDVASVEVLLGQCEPAALADKRAGLKPVSGINYDFLVGRLNYATDGIEYFGKALSYYQDNLLGPAATILENLPGLFGPDCQNYQERAKQGLQKIAVLQQFDARLVSAIDTCGMDQLEAMRAEVADRSHKYFAEARGRIEGALSSCAGRRSAEAAARNCEAATAALNKARASYKANNLRQATGELAAAQDFLDPAANELCPEIGARIAQGNANIAVIQHAEAELQGALANCDIERLKGARAQATSQSHVWFRTAVGRIDEALAQCDKQVENQCEMVRSSFAAADELFIAGNFEAVMVALGEMKFRAEQPEAIVGCEDLVARIPGATDFVQNVIGMIGRGEAAIASCDSADIESALAAIDASGTKNVRVDEVKAQLVAAQEACQPPADEPDPVVTAEPAPETVEGAGALEILRDAQARLKIMLDDVDKDMGFFAQGTASGDRRVASVTYDVTSANRTNDVPTSSVTIRNRITLAKFGSDEEARPQPQPGEELNADSWLGFQYLSSYTGNEGETHATMRFSKGTVRVEIVSDLTGFTVLNEEGESDRGYPFAGMAGAIIGKYLYESIDTGL